MVRGLYRAARTQELRNDYALSNQMKRAAVSIASNIAEGFERGTRRQHIEFCYFAKGSAGELRSQIIIAHDVGLLDEQAHTWLVGHCESCWKMLAAYIGSLQQSPIQFPGVKYGLAEQASVRK